jgi:hypothetical protein
VPGVCAAITPFHLPTCSALVSHTRDPTTPPWWTTANRPWWRGRTNPGGRTTPGRHCSDQFASAVTTAIPWSPRTSGGDPPYDHRPPANTTVVTTADSVKAQSWTAYFTPVQKNVLLSHTLPASLGLGSSRGAAVGRYHLSHSPTLLDGGTPLPPPLDVNTQRRAESVIARAPPRGQQAGRPPAPLCCHPPIILTYRQAWGAPAPVGPWPPQSGPRPHPCPGRGPCPGPPLPPPPPHPTHPPGQPDAQGRATLSLTFSRHAV